MMKTSFSSLIFVCIINIEFIIQVNAATCWDHPNPLEPWEKTVSSVCGFQEENFKINLENDQTNPLDQVLAADDVFHFDFSCGLSDRNVCNKVENIFKSAGQIIANSLNLVTPITVNATYTGFCQALDKCGTNIIGSANIARTIPLQDDDNVIRQYPQALAKQFLLNPQPQWGTYDIQALFNSEVDLFLGDGQIGPDQYDFKYIVLHELIHGLGFTSSWNNYLFDQPISLTPDPEFLAGITSLGQSVKFTSFEELAFDKYMVNVNGPSLKRMSEFAKEINGFAEVGTQFPTVEELLTDFTTSSQFKISQDLINDAQTPKTMAFLPQNGKTLGDLIFLETSLNPYRFGSSISHMDFSTFNGGEDFLEVYRANAGKTLDQLVAGNGGKNPIGPKLQSVLETLGYASVNNPNPYRPKSSQVVSATSEGVSRNNPSPSGQKPPQESSPIPDKNLSVGAFLTSSFDILSIFIIATIILLF